MATTRLIAMHQNKGKTIAACLSDRTDYATNPEKTNEGELVSSYECDPRTVQGEFMLSKRLYSEVTGRTQKSNVIAYQIRQAFKPNEITPDLANQIGYELGMRFTKGNHAFIVATHIDKSHIHNHIIFNSTSLDGTKKFRDFLGSGKALAKISDIICIENNLSIIENPKRSKGHYGKWLGDNKPLNYSDKLRITIDDALAKKPNTLEEFLELMAVSGYQIKRGKHISFKSTEQKKFIRMRSLGEEYSEEKIRKTIEGKTEEKAVNNSENSREKVDLLVDIEAKMQGGKGKGYEQWAKVFNLKQMAKTINYLRENDLLDYEKLDEKAKEISANFDEISAEIKGYDRRIKEIQDLKKHIVNYMKTREVYAQYRKSGYSKKFYEIHQTELILHKASKVAFDDRKLKKLPSIKSLNEEYYELISFKKKAYLSYKTTRKDMQEIVIAKENIDRMLNVKCIKHTNKIKDK
ncbi:MAG: relaxase/mobilization nuclease domain-containing protein [Clostridia bacterium]